MFSFTRRKILNNIEAPLMHKIILSAAALAFVGLGATGAWAGNYRYDDGHSQSDYGVGGWHWNHDGGSRSESFKFDSGRSHSESFHFDNGSHSSSTSASVSNTVQFNVVRPILAKPHAWVARFHSNSDCNYVQKRNSTGIRWEAGCN
jgi:hypothetical protein